MGANINLFSTCLGEAPCRFKNKNHIHSAIIHGPTPLTGSNFRMPTDIRAGMCLVIGWIGCFGNNTLSNIQELQRKYDNIVEKLNQMGGDVSIETGQLIK